MDSRKSKKIRPAQRQKNTIRLLLAAGVSAAIITIVFVIYFQFFKNEVTKARNIENLTQENLPVDLNITEKVIENTDTLMRNGNRYKVAQPLSQTPAAPVQ